MGKKKKKKKKKLLRLKELRKIEQAQKPDSISSIQEEELSEVNKETKKETNEPKVEVSRKEKKSEVSSENKLFKRDLRRAFIVIVRRILLCSPIYSLFVHYKLKRMLCTSCALFCIKLHRES